MHIGSVFLCVCVFFFLSFFFFFFGGGGGVFWYQKFDFLISEIIFSYQKFGISDIKKIISDIKKLDFWYQKIGFLISENPWISDVRKSHLFSDTKNDFLIPEINFWYHKMIFWYQNSCWFSDIRNWFSDIRKFFKPKVYTSVFWISSDKFLVCAVCMVCINILELCISLHFLDCSWPLGHDLVCSQALQT